VRNLPSQGRLFPAMVRVC